MAARMHLQSLVGHSMLYRLANRAAIASRMTSTSVHRLVSSKGANISIARLHTCLLTPLQRPAWKQASTKYASIFSNRAVSYQNPVCAVQLPSSDEDLPEPGTPEAPPQVPDGSGYVPGTDKPAVEEVSGFSGSDAEAAADATPLFLQNWGNLELALVQNGAELGNGIDEAMDAKGAIKKACIKVGRSRPEAIYSLNAIDISAFTANCLLENRRGAETPLKDRKCTNALQRLEASFVKEAHLEIARGGSAEFADLMRVLVSLYLFITGEFGRLSEDAMAISAVLVEDVTRVLQSEPSPDAVAMAAEADVRRAALADQLAAERASRETERRQRYGPGGSDSSRPRLAENFRSGDWVCSDCGFLNFASRQECKRCFKPHSGEDEVKTAGRPPPGNFGRSNDFGRSSDFGRRGDAGLPSSVRPGDWTCPTCSFNNFASRTSCFKCQTPRDDAPAFGSQGSQGRFDSPQRRDFGGDRPPRIVRDNRDSGFPQSRRDDSNTRPGDWVCPECGVNNFASRTSCFRCQIEKPGGAASPFQTENRGSDRSRRPPSRGARRADGPPTDRGQNVPPPSQLDW